jgi:hypothetical protein
MRRAAGDALTRGSRGIVKPREYKDGTVKWGLSSSLDEPENLQDALAKP